MSDPKPDVDADRVERCRLLRDEVLGLGETEPEYLIDPLILEEQTAAPVGRR